MWLVGVTVVGERGALQRQGVLNCRLLTQAPRRSTLRRSASIRSAWVKVTSRRSAPDSFAPVNRAPSSCARCRVAPSRFASMRRSAPRRLARVRSAPRRSAHFTAPLRFTPCRLALRKLASVKVPSPACYRSIRPVPSLSFIRLLLSDWRRMSRRLKSAVTAPKRRLASACPAYPRYVGLRMAPASCRQSKAARSPATAG